jgi:hypothetical protein
MLGHIVARSILVGMPAIAELGFAWLRHGLTLTARLEISVWKPG